MQAYNEPSATMSENDPNRIVRLIAAYGTRTTKTWYHSHNKSRYIPPSFKDFRQSSCVAPPDDTKPEIRLAFDRPPKDPSEGFVFGSDKRICDVYCGVAEDGISRKMFHITFNDNG